MHECHGFPLLDEDEEEPVEDPEDEDEEADESEELELELGAPDRCLIMPSVCCCMS